MNTIEAALSLSALVIVAGAIVAALATMGAYISAVDIAGAAARAHAIGLDYDPPAGRVTTQERGGMVTVTARVRGMEATAVFPTEFGG